MPDDLGVRKTLQQGADADRVLVPVVTARADHPDEVVVEHHRPLQLRRECVDERL
ncbi:hypothetical protein ACFQFR_02335 [Streptomyces goshikiensis]